MVQFLCSKQSKYFLLLHFSPSFNCISVLKVFKIAFWSLSQNQFRLPRRCSRSTCHELVGSNATRQLINSAQCQNQSGFTTQNSRHITKTESIFSLLAVTDQIHQSSQETQEHTQTLTQNQYQCRTISQKTVEFIIESNSQKQAKAKCE